MNSTGRIRSGALQLRADTWVSFRFSDRPNVLACLLACVDTAENEPLEVWGKIQFIIHLPPRCRPGCEGRRVKSPLPYENHVRRAAGRLTRSKLLAKRPHSGGHWPGKKLNNVEEDLRNPTFRTLPSF